MRKQVMATLDNLVPQDDIVRKLDSTLRFSFIADEIQEYGNEAQTSDISPEFIARYLLLIHLYDLERPTPARMTGEQRVNDSMANRVDFRWFLWLDLGNPVPSYADVRLAIGKFGGQEKWDMILSRLLQQCTDKGLPDKKGGADC